VTVFKINCFICCQTSSTEDESGVLAKKVVLNCRYFRRLVALKFWGEISFCNLAHGVKALMY